MHTLGSRLQPRVFHHIGAFRELSDDAAIVLIDQNDLSRSEFPGSGGISFARSVVRRIVSSLFALARAGGCRAFEKSGTLSQDRLERVHILLRNVPLAFAKRRKLDSGESTRVGTEIPSWNEVAAGRLMVYLRRCGERQVQLRRQMKVKIEVLFGHFVLRSHGRQVRERRRGRDHQQRQRLRAGRGEGRLVAVLHMVGFDAGDCVEQSGLVVACHGDVREDGEMSA